MRSFLGLCNVYRRFVKDFASIASPLSKKLKKDEPEYFALDDAEMGSFRDLIEKLTSPPVLALPVAGQPYTLEVDANANQLGCVLLQKQSEGPDDGVDKPIGFFSKTLTEAEQNYDTTERECAAIIWSVLLLKPYLDNEHFTMKTDHDALKWLFADTSNGKVARWRLRLQEFSFTVIHIPGTKNRVADALSRLKTEGGDQRDQPVDVEVPVLSLPILAIEDDVNPMTFDDKELGITDGQLKDFPEPVEPISLQEMLVAQQDDFECQTYAYAVGLPSSPFDFNKDGVLTRTSPLDGARQTVVPASLRERVILLSHTPVAQGHPGEKKLYQTLREKFYWPFMAGDAIAHVSSCRSCAKARGLLRKKQHKTVLFPPRGPLADIAMDLLGPLPMTKNGNQFILVITCRYSKLTRSIPMSKTTAPFIATSTLNHWILPYGIPESILTDNGSQFIAEFFKTVCYILGIKRKTTTAYHPQTNGQAERYNKTIAARLRHYVSEHQDNWDMFVQPLTYAYNNQVHASTGTTPFNLALSRSPPSPIFNDESTIAPLDDTVTPSSRTMRAHLLKRLSTMFDKADSISARARARYKRYADRSIKLEAVFNPGDFVLLQRPPSEAKTAEEKEENVAQSKLHYKMTGPYKVISATTETVTIMQDGDVVTVSNDRCVKDPKNEDAEDEDRNERLYEAEDITMTDEVQRDEHGAVTDQSETILRWEPDPEPPTVQNDPIPTYVRVLSQGRLPDGTPTYQVECSDGAYVVGVPPSISRRTLLTNTTREWPH